MNSIRKTQSLVVEDILNGSNSIGFLRLVAALLVVIGHSTVYGFSGDPLISLTNNQLAIGRFPVDLFFCLSGFLIIASYARINDVLTFFWHRFLRIFPAFWICLVITGIIIPYLVKCPIEWSYLYQNFTLYIADQNVCEIAFDGISINSALWTLKWEWFAYCLVGIIGVLGLNRANVWLFIFLICYSVFVFQIISSPVTLETNSAISSPFRLLTFFTLGAVFFFRRNSIKISHFYGLLSLVFILVITFLGTLYYEHSAGLFYLLGPIPFTYFVFYLSIVLPLQKINSKTDISYGIYIYGTLLLNVLCYFNLNNNYVYFITLNIAITILISYLSWKFIEKPCLSLKSIKPFSATRINQK